MNAAAVAVMSELPDVVVAYGVSDEFRYVFDRCVWCAHGAAILSVIGALAYVRVYSFVFQRSCSLFERRERYVLFHSSHSRLPRVSASRGLGPYTSKKTGAL